jgi:Brp/Blh family beta-carotene 15,15'-monooxygenase
MTMAASPPVYERLAFPVITAVALMVLLLVPNSLSLNAQLVMLAALVVVVGLPHGALDPWLAEQAGLAQTKSRAFGFNVLYLLAAAVIVMIWMWLPVLSLAVFLGISAWHFSSDWQCDMGLPPRLAAGVLLLLMPIGFHPDNVAMLFAHLSGPGGHTLAQALALPPWLLMVGMLGLVVLAMWQRHWLTALEYLSLLLLAYVATPLVYFVLYFCALHSLRHLAGLFRRAPAVDRPRMWRMTLTYTVATVGLTAILWLLWSHLPLDTLILKLVFVGLAAVTVPHMILIAWARFKGVD